MTVLVVATGNPGKLREIQPYLEGLRWELKLKPPEIEVDEVGTTFAENAALKASQVAIATQNWAIADDSGLEVTALDNAPGIFSARYGLSDGDRIDRLLRELGDHGDRSARFVCAIAVAQPDGAIALQTEGICLGEILTAARGKGGFGYDPIFYVPDQGLTFAEMPAALKQEVSHRGRAFQSILPRLKALDAEA
nr:RdgB/HAM1 family non-canonical purine NTP pyrophosphatase [Myxacorys almedinensis]